MSDGYTPNNEEPVDKEISDELLAKSSDDGTIKDKVSKRSNPPQRVVDRVPRIRGFEKITVYAYLIGHRGYRYSVAMPNHVKVDWQAEMSGSDAHKFLTTIKNANRQGRLESKELPASNTE